MSLELMSKYYEKMQKAYMDCIKEATATALFEAWGENWYAILKQKDIELTDETNKKREESAKKKGKDPSRVPYIAKKYDSILKFDFQACNKLLYYMDEVRGIVYKEYGKSEIFENRKEDDKYKDNINGLIDFRNAFEGHNAHENEMPTAEDLEVQATAISNMRMILKDILGDVINLKDIAKRTYFLSFEDYRTAFERELLKKPYLLEKYLDYSKFDAERFYEACQDLGIEGKKIEGKDVFYSANLNDDLQKLKNALYVSDSVQQQPVTPPVVQPVTVQIQQPDVQENKKKVPYKMIGIIAVIVFLCIVIAFLLGKTLSGNNNGGANAPTVNNSQIQSSSQQTVSNESSQANNSTSSQLPNNTSSEAETSSQVTVGTAQNELNSEYNQDVEEFKYLNKAQRNLRTLKIDVGEKITPQAAAVWGDCEIFSQNTAIAKAQGNIVEGISKGETYIVVEASTGMSQVFMVVVG